MAEACADLGKPLGEEHEMKALLVSVIILCIHDCAGEAPDPQCLRKPLAPIES